ncbi:MAG: nuclear transport factor 2 family protein [Chthoniobacterales bacterium]
MDATIQTPAALGFQQFREICRRFLLLVSLCTLFACSPRSHFDAAAEEKKLLQRDAEWAALATAGQDVEKIVSYWSDDAVLIFPGQPTLEGKAAIRDYVAASLKTPGFKIRWVSKKVVFSPDGKMAYMPATDELTVPGPNGQPITIPLRGMAIWRLDSDGQWRCVVDMANEQPSASPAPRE